MERGREAEGRSFGTEKVVNPWTNYVDTIMEAVELEATHTCAGVSKNGKENCEFNCWIRGFAGSLFRR